MTSIKEIRKHSSSYYESKREISFDFINNDSNSVFLKVRSKNWKTVITFPIKKILWWETLGVPYDKDNKDVPTFVVKLVKKLLEECYLSSIVLGVEK